MCSVPFKMTFFVFLQILCAFKFLAALCTGKNLSVQMRCHVNCKLARSGEFFPTMLTAVDFGLVFVPLHMFFHPSFIGEAFAALVA